ncbi:hypothetical protein B0O99DRAFT_614827 [Bisporella sp. PMI_857]|nr:hypothetical protein B0O99DRAFT_614827 [Bisporella sp. PMI_857]
MAAPAKKASKYQSGGVGVSLARYDSTSQNITDYKSFVTQPTSNFSIPESKSYEHAQYNNNVAQFASNTGDGYYNNVPMLNFSQNIYGQTLDNYALPYSYPPKVFSGHDPADSRANYNYATVGGPALFQASVPSPSNRHSGLFQSPKRQRTQGPSRLQDSYKRSSQVGNRQGPADNDDAASLISSECCSSCSSGEPCDQPDCETLKVVIVPCDKQSCDESACPCPDPCITKVTEDSIMPSIEISHQASRIDHWKNENFPWTAAAPPVNSGAIHVQIDPDVQRAVDTLSIISSSTSSAPTKRPAGRRVKRPQAHGNTAIYAGFSEQVSPSGEDGRDSTMVSGIGTHFDNSTGALWPPTYPEKPNGFPVFNCGWMGCAEPFYSEQELDFHLHQKHIDPQLIFRCPAPACKEKMSPEPLQNHIELDHGFNFTNGTICPAPDCSQEPFGNLDDFHNHFHQAHTDPIIQPLECGWDSCGNQFQDQTDLWNHLPEHYHLDVNQGADARDSVQEPKYPTTIMDDELPGNHACRWKGAGCGKTFGSEETLQQHVLEEHIKTLEKTKIGYLCEWDGCKRKEKPKAAGFDQRSKIERHMYTHTGHKPSKCDICGARFSADQARDQHVRSAHTKEKPFQCSYCPKRFPQQSAWLMHERTHTGDKPLKCDICGQKFGESSNLAKHRKTHGVQGSFTCAFPSCGKSFVRANQLKMHQREHRDSCSRSIAGETSTELSTDVEENNA